MWTTIIMIVLSFILTRKKTGSTGTALAAAALAGAGTYYATTQTDWFDKDNALTSWPEDSAKLVQAVDSEGNPITDADGQPVMVPNKVGTTTGQVGNGSGVIGTVVGTTGEVLKSWGGTGTATVIGAGAVASKVGDVPPWVMWAGLGLLVYSVIK